MPIRAQEGRAEHPNPQKRGPKLRPPGISTREQPHPATASLQSFTSHVPRKTAGRIRLYFPQFFLNILNLLLLKVSEC